MKTICITGAAAPDLHIVSGILQQSGMKAALPANREDAVDIAFWHEKVMAQAAEESAAAQAIANPGRVWEQLASDIFVANINAPVWGWADTRSTWALDYWCDFEPRFYAVLVCVSPQQMLARALATQTEAISVDAVMAAWQQHHQELLRFHHRNPQRSLLVDVSQCAENPQALIERCVQQWKLPLAAPKNAAPRRIEQGPLALYLAHQLLQGYPQSASLQHELDATLSVLSPTQQVANGASLAPDSVHFLADYRALQDRSQELQQVQAAQEELVALKSTYAHAVAEGSQLQARLEKTIQENIQKIEILEFQLGQAEGEIQVSYLKHEIAQTENEQLSQALDQLIQSNSALNGEKEALSAERDQHAQQAAERQASLGHKIKEATQENELLLLQLHQVQEELESIFLKHEAAQNDSHKIAQARDAQAKLAAEHQVQIEQLSQSHTALKGEKEALAQEKGALVSRRDSLERESAALAQARDAQAKLAAERQAKIEALSAERDQHAQQAAERQASLGHKIKEATQENELLLLQLHQVQEELEHYFLQQQNAQQQLSSAEERWQRMLQRTPDYCDYASIEILPGENSADGAGTESASCTWRLKNLNAAGRTLPQLDFDTLVEQGVAGWVIHRSPGSAGPLIRWPSAAAQQNDVTLIPLDPAERVETLRDLAARDWDLLQTLAQLLANTLEAPGDLKLPANLQTEPLRSGLEHFSRIIAEFPATLRYDAVGLKREQVNRDYEHLWLHFDNLAFDGQRWPAFEFRLSCANVRPNLFGKYPKLEFPEESGQAPFEAWFIEAYDDFGAKLELRFALPESMDLGVWQQVSERDQNFLRALIERLPAILLTLQSAGISLKRSWDDWIAMAREMQRITALRAAPPPAPEAAPAATLAPEKPLPALNAEAEPVEKAAARPAASPKTAQPSPAVRAIKMRKV